MSWTAATLKPLGEKRAKENLVAQGYQVYAPRFRDQTTRKVTPLFPGYILIQFESAWASIKGTLGIASLLMSGDQPACVPTHEVAALRSREDAAGIIELEPSQMPRGRFGQGDKVRVEGGAFWGRTATFDGMSPQERCIVLLKFMGREVRTQVRLADLSPV